MAEFPALPLWTDAFLADTTHLSRDEIGAYLLLLFAEWRRPDCRLPDDDSYLARITRCSPDEWAGLRPIMEQFFTIEAGFWSQKRLVSERDKVKARADRARANGQAGGRPRKQENNDLKNPAGSSSKTQKKAPHIHIPDSPSPSLHSGEGEPPSALTLTGDDPKPKAKRKTRLTETDLPQRWDLWAKAQGHPDPQAEWERFRDYWTGRGETMADWEATWRNWVRRALQDGKPAIGSKKPEPLAQVQLDQSLEPWLPKLAREFDPSALRSWFTRVRAIESDDWITLVAPSKFIADYIRQQFATKLRAVFGDQVQVTHQQPRGKAA